MLIDLLLYLFSSPNNCIWYTESFLLSLFPKLPVNALYLRSIENQKYESNKNNNYEKAILFSIVLCLAVSANAQIRFGVKAGGNFSNLYTSGSNEGFNADQYKGRFSYHFGAMAEYSLSNIFSIQPELMYLNHGTNMKKENSFGMKDGHVTLNTLQLPINLKAHLREVMPNYLHMLGPMLATICMVR